MNMPTLNMRGLLREGKSIELRDRNRLIGRIVPETVEASAVEWPDFQGRLDKIFQGRTLTAVDDFLKDRHRW